MRFENLTPHQYEPLRAFTDTVVFSGYSPQPLDIAVPHLASHYISTHLTHVFTERFQGRVSHIPIGPSLQFCPINEEGREALLGLYPYDAAVAVILTDRLLITDLCTIETPRTTWLVFDWWQWTCKRVPHRRLPDAWMFMVHATSLYWNSNERKSLGIDEPTALQMSAEGQNLLTRISEWIATSLTSHWARMDV